MDYRGRCPAAQSELPSAHKKQPETNRHGTSILPEQPEAIASSFVLRVNSSTARRFQLRCELDAAFVHLYLGPEDEWRQQPESLTKSFPTSRDAVSYILDTLANAKRSQPRGAGGGDPNPIVSFTCLHFTRFLNRFARYASGWSAFTAVSVW